MAEFPPDFPDDNEEEPPLYPAEMPRVLWEEEVLPPEAEPSFPSWVLGFDPYLEAEQTSLAYQLFRMRRLEHGGSGLRKLLPGGLFALARTVLFAGLVVLFLPAAFMGYPLALLIPGLVLAGISYLRRGKPLESRRMPWWVSDVFSEWGVQRQAAIDLWLAGIGGREILLALYLERQRPFAWALTTVYWGLVALGCGAVVLQYGLGPMTVVVVAALGFFAWQLRPYLYMARMSKILLVDFKHLMRSWRSEESAAFEGSVRFFRAIWFGALALVLATCLSCAVVPGFNAAGRWILASFLGLLGLAMSFRREDWLDSIAHRADKLLAQADMSFDALIVGRLMGEGEAGRAWARWYRHPRRLADLERRGERVPVLVPEEDSWRADDSPTK